MDQIVQEALKIASKELYHTKGCMGGYFCTVATTCYEPEELEEICSRCWKQHLMELAKYALQKEEN